MVKPFLSNLETVHLEAYELFQHHAYPTECAYAGERIVRVMNRKVCPPFSIVIPKGGGLFFRLTRTDILPFTHNVLFFL